MSPAPVWPERIRALEAEIERLRAALRDVLESGALARYADTHWTVCKALERKP